MSNIPEWKRKLYEARNVQLPATEPSAAAAASGGQQQQQRTSTPGSAAGPHRGAALRDSNNRHNQVLYRSFSNLNAYDDDSGDEYLGGHAHTDYGPAMVEAKPKRNGTHMAPHMNTTSIYHTDYGPAVVEAKPNRNGAQPQHMASHMNTSGIYHTDYGPATVDVKPKRSGAQSQYMGSHLSTSAHAHTDYGPAMADARPKHNGAQSQYLGTSSDMNTIHGFTVTLDSEDKQKKRRASKADADVPLLIRQASRKVGEQFGELKKKLSSGLPHLMPSKSFNKDKENKENKEKEKKQPKEVAAPAPAGPAANAGPRLLRDPRKALEVFQDDRFAVQDYISATYQGLAERGVEIAAQQLLTLKQRCHQEVQGAMLQHHQLFLDCCQHREQLDEAVTQLRSHVQDANAIVVELKQAMGVPQARGRRNSSTAADTAHPSLSQLLRFEDPSQQQSLATLSAQSTGSTAAKRRPTAEAIEAEVRNLLCELEGAIAEQDYGTAASLLGLAAEVMAIISRDAAVLATEVGDVSQWRKPWDTALADCHKALVQGLEEFLSRASGSGGIAGITVTPANPSLRTALPVAVTSASHLSVMELRGATAVLCALCGDRHAATALLESHSARIQATRQQLLRQHNAVGSTTEEDAQQFGASLVQHALLGVAAAAEDVAAVWGTHGVVTHTAAPILSRWAEREVRRAAGELRQYALQPYADTASLTTVLLPVQLGMVICGALELSHSLSLTSPFLAELWPHIEASARSTLSAVSDQIHKATQEEVVHALTLPMSGDQAAEQPAVELQCGRVLVAQLTHICSMCVPLAGARLAACLAPGLQQAAASIVNGMHAAFEQLKQGARRQSAANLLAAAAVAEQVSVHIRSLLLNDGPVMQALSPLQPVCGQLADFSNLRDTARDTALDFAAWAAKQPLTPPVSATASEVNSSDSKVPINTEPATMTRAGHSKPPIPTKVEHSQTPSTAKAEHSKAPSTAKVGHSQAPGTGRMEHSQAPGTARVEDGQPPGRDKVEATTRLTAMHSPPAGHASDGAAAPTAGKAASSQPDAATPVPNKVASSQPVGTAPVPSKVAGLVASLQSTSAAPAAGKGSTLQPDHAASSPNKVATSQPDDTVPVASKHASLRPTPVVNKDASLQPDDTTPVFSKSSLRPVGAHPATRPPASSPQGHVSKPESQGQEAHPSPLMPRSPFQEAARRPVRPVDATSTGHAADSGKPNNRTSTSQASETGKLNHRYSTGQASESGKLHHRSSLSGVEADDSQEGESTGQLSPAPSTTTDRSSMADAGLPVAKPTRKPGAATSSRTALRSEDKWANLHKGQPSNVPRRTTSRVSAALAAKARALEESSSDDGSSSSKPRTAVPQRMSLAVATRRGGPNSRGTAVSASKAVANDSGTAGPPSTGTVPGRPQVASRTQARTGTTSIAPKLSNDANSDSDRARGVPVAETGSRGTEQKSEGLVQKRLAAMRAAAAASSGDDEQAEGSRTRPVSRPAAASKNTGMPLQGEARMPKAPAQGSQAGSTAGVATLSWPAPSVPKAGSTWAASRAVPTPAPSAAVGAAKPVTATADVGTTSTASQRAGSARSAALARLRARAGAAGSDSD